MTKVMSVHTWIAKGGFMKNEISENWCKEISKDLSVFNKAFIKRAGNGLFPYIVLKGTEKSILYCLEQEALLFYQSGLYDNETIHEVGKDKERGIYYETQWKSEHENDYEVLKDNGSLVFFAKGIIPRANSYDVSGCEIFSFKTSFLTVCNMKCEDETLAYVLEQYPGIQNMDMLEVTNNTILMHYANHDDDTLTKDDFLWLQENNPKKKLKPDLPPKEETAKTEQKEHSRKNDKEQKSNIIENTQVKDKVKSSEPNKDVIDKKNRLLLNKVQQKYEKLIDYIKELNVSMWKPIEQLASHAIKTKNYSDSLIMKYLNLSKDVTTELYRILYEEVEPERQNFEKNVKRTVKTIKCFNCGNETEVDVTFMEEDHGSIECSKCGVQLGYDRSCESETEK